MGRKTLGVKGYSPDQIRNLFNSDDKYKIGLRLYAVYQVALGQPSRKLEDLYNTSFKQITNWVHKFELEGLEGLRDKPGRGRIHRLTQENRERVKELLSNESPEEFGYNTSTWTGPIVIDWIKKHMDVCYGKAQIYNIIKSLGFSYQKSRGFYPEADPLKQEEFKEDLKKTS